MPISKTSRHEKAVRRLCSTSYHQRSMIRAARRVARTKPAVPRRIVHTGVSPLVWLLHDLRRSRLSAKARKRLFWAVADSLQVGGPAVLPEEEAFWYIGEHQFDSLERHVRWCQWVDGDHEALTRPLTWESAEDALLGSGDYLTQGNPGYAISAGTGNLLVSGQHPGGFYGPLIWHSEWLNCKVPLVVTDEVVRSAAGRGGGPPDSVPRGKFLQEATDLQVHNISQMGRLAASARDQIWLSSLASLLGRDDLLDSDLELVSLLVQQGVPLDQALAAL